MDMWEQEKLKFKVIDDPEYDEDGVPEDVVRFDAELEGKRFPPKIRPDRIATTLCDSLQDFRRGVNDASVHVPYAESESSLWRLGYIYKNTIMYNDCIIATLEAELQRVNTNFKNLQHNRAVKIKNYYEVKNMLRDAIELLEDSGNE